jgi:quercetin dioxygenase-like cupin family protein
MKITRLDQCPTHPVDMPGVLGALKQVPLGRDDGLPTFSVRVFTLEPGGHTPHHAHAAEHVNYVLEGSGELLGDDGPRPLRTGDFAFVAPQERHQYRNTGTSPLRFLCMVPSAYE